ncbi:MAG TPA: hypothetical protein VMV49_13510 [Candidatus Deferrimicrobium sp.]|nr:hypothetical protein [Candidatus Deferrimicrobium sp.]
MAQVQFFELGQLVQPGDRLDAVVHQTQFPEVFQGVQPRDRLDAVVPQAEVDDLGVLVQAEAADPKRGVTTPLNFHDPIEDRDVLVVGGIPAGNGHEAAGSEQAKFPEYGGNGGARVVPVRLIEPFVRLGLGEGEQLRIVAGQLVVSPQCHELPCNTRVLRGGQFRLLSEIFARHYNSIKKRRYFNSSEYIAGCCAFR